MAAATAFDKRRSMIDDPTQMYHTMAVSNRASTRLSTYSMTPTLAPSIAPSHLSCTPSRVYSDAGKSESSMTSTERSSPLAHDIRTLTHGFARLDQPKLQNQRYYVTDKQKEGMEKLALGAKLDKALSRRMVGQDASFSNHGKHSKLKVQMPRHVDVMAYGHMARAGEKSIAA